PRAGWACEMTALMAAEKGKPEGHVRWADFDRMLDRMATELHDIASFFGLDAREEQVAEVVAGPMMRRYSKALEFDYSRELRRELLQEARQDHRQAIDAALAMLARAAARSPL